VYKNGAWYQRQSNTDNPVGSGYVLYSDTPWTSNLGYYYDNGKADNPFTLTVSCKKDGVITIEWDDEAGFYIDDINIFTISVLR
jgi:hypothetical protein